MKIESLSKEQFDRIIRALEFAASAYNDDNTTGELASILHEVSCVARHAMEMCKDAK